MQNQFAILLTELWDRLALINGLAWQTDTRLSAHRKDLESRISTGSLSEQFLGARANIVLRDLTEWPPDRWAVHYSVAGHGAFGSSYLALVDALLENEYAWAIAQAYDALEIFLRRFAAEAFHANPTLLGHSWRRLRKMLPNKRLRPRSLNGWRSRVAASDPSVTSLHSFLDSWLPSFRDAATRNNRNLPLQAWLLAAGRARHAIVHTGMLVENRAIRNADMRTRRALREYFGAKRQVGGYRLRPTRDLAHGAIVNIAEYALLALKITSEHFGLPWRQVLPPKASATGAA